MTMILINPALKGCYVLLEMDAGAEARWCKFGSIKRYLAVKMCGLFYMPCCYMCFKCCG